MEVEAALDVGLLRFRGLVTLVARMQVALERVLRVRDGVRVDCRGLDQANRITLDRAGCPEFIPAPGQHDVVEPTTSKKGRGGRKAEVDGERNGLIAVVLRHHLPHVRARRDLERADVAPAEVHAVVADVRSAPELIAHDDAVAAADGDLALEVRVTDREYVLGFY